MQTANYTNKELVSRLYAGGTRNPKSAFVRDRSGVAHENPRFESKSIFLPRNPDCVYDDEIGNPGED